MRRRRRSILFPGLAMTSRGLTNKNGVENFIAKIDDVEITAFQY
jgi:hypothetical protein